VKKHKGVKLKTYKIFYLLIYLIVLVSCSMSLPTPEVHTRGNVPTTPNTHFYILGSPRFGMLNYIEDILNEKRFSAETVMDKRDIPVPESNTRTRHYIISHELDQVSEGERRGGRSGRGGIDRPNITAEELEREFMNETWRLVVRVLEFNPRGTDRQVAIATTTTTSYTPRELMYAVMNELFRQSEQ
jgi:hypothetical protein